MKPLYVFLLLYAVFITGLSDGISFALLAIPVVGPVLAIIIAFCINATMGAGLLIALASFGMWHPRLSPFGIIGGLIPGLNVLPFWVGLVIAGIAYKMNADGESVGGITGAALSLQSVYQSGGSPLQKMRGAAGIVMNERRATGRPPQATNESEPQSEGENKSRVLPNLKSPSLAPNMNSDIAPVKNQLHAKTA